MDQPRIKRSAWGASLTMTDDQITSIISQSIELRHVEFKSGFALLDSSNKSRACSVYRAMMAMANLRGGGYVILGVADDHTKLSLENLAPEALEGWEQDILADKLSSYTEPTVNFLLRRTRIDGSALVVIRVSEFDDCPIICKKPYPEKLREGALYIRPKGLLRSEEVSTYADMRHLIELASEKTARKLIRSITRLTGHDLSVYQGNNADRQRMLGDVFSSLPAYDEITKGGYWSLLVEPLDARNQWPSLAELESEILAASVAHIGWGFPVPEVVEFKPQRADNRILFHYAHSHYAGTWQYSKSGRFAVIEALPEDHLDKSEYPLPWTPPDWRAGERLGLMHVINRLDIYFRFIERLYSAERISSSVRVTLGLHKLAERSIVYEPPYAGVAPPRELRMATKFPAASDPFVRSYTYDVIDLISGIGARKMEFAQELLELFSCDFSLKTLWELVDSEEHPWA